MNTTVVASSALEHGPGLFRMVRAFGRAAGTDESGGLHLPPEMDTRGLHLPPEMDTRGLHLPPEMDTAVAASLLCQAWAVSVTRASIASLVGARRMPDVTASNTVLDCDHRSRPAGISLLSPRYAALSGDREAAGHRGAEIVADEDALFAWARARLFDGHLHHLVEALHDRFPVGRRLLWGNVAAATAGAFAALSAGSHPATAPFDPDRLMGDARRLLDEPGSPTEGLVDVFPVTSEDGTRLFVRRQTCCLRYRLPDAPPTCLSCRLVPEGERLRRIAARLAVPVG